MKSLFITALFNLKPGGHLGRGIRLSDTLFLTNDSNQIRPLLSENFVQLAGLIEIGVIRKAGAIIYGLTEHSQSLTEEDARQFLDRQLSFVQLFLMVLWLFKDNSVNMELGFLEYPYRVVGSSVSSNFRAVRFCEASGIVQDCEFSEKEVRSARDVYRLLEASAVQLGDKSVGYIVPTDFTRFDRAFYFAQVARSSSNLGLKTANYVTCFECLFCTDSAELAVERPRIVGHPKRRKATALA